MLSTTERIELSKTILKQHATALGISVPNLVRALETTDSKYRQARERASSEIARLCGDRSVEALVPDIDVVVMGSMGRGEMSDTESDFDYIVLTYGLITDPFQIWVARKAADAAERAVAFKETGKTTGFGGLTSSSQLVNVIGLETDTNITHTHRILLLEESVSLLNDASYGRLVRSVLKRYLYDYEPGPDGQDRSKRGVPRFLLNDVVRYWRTLGVDYQAKRWEELEGEKWGMRYLKLRSTRKLTFVATVVSLFLPRIRDAVVHDDLLVEQFSLMPMARLSQLEAHLNDSEDRRCLAEIFRLADRFSNLYNDPEFRDQVNQVQHPRDAGNPTFAAARRDTQRLQEFLEALFNSDRPIRAASVDGDGNPLTLRFLTARYLLF